MKRSDRNQGELICGIPRHESIKRDPAKVRAHTHPARPQPLDDGTYLQQRHCIACGSTITIPDDVAAAL
jgi:hypothetical protein